MRIQWVRGNIALQPDIDAIVNAANAQLRSGAGVAGAIHAAAGPGLERECRAFAPLRPGQAVITGAHGLPYRFVIDCLGPVYGRDEPADELLAACHGNALRLAAQDGVGSVAFPAISTGAFGYPLEPAAEAAMRGARVGGWGESDRGLPDPVRPVRCQRAERFPQSAAAPGTARIHGLTVRASVSRWHVDP